MGHRAGCIRRWDNNEFDLQPEGVGLICNQFSTDSVHRDAVVHLAQTGDQLDNLDVRVSLAGVMESEGAVFSPLHRSAALRGVCIRSVACGWHYKPWCASPTHRRLPCHGAACVKSLVRQRSDCNRGGPAGSFTPFAAVL